MKHIKLKRAVLSIIDITALIILKGNYASEDVEVTSDEATGGSTSSISAI